MRPRADRGFTLIEVLAVLVVLATIALLAGVRIGTRAGADAVQAAAQEIAARCRAGRMTAVRTGREQILLIDAARRSFDVGRSEAPYELPPNIALTVDVSDTELRSHDVAGIKFFADGSSTGGVIHLASGRRAYEVHVNWFTGRVQVQLASK